MRLARRMERLGTETDFSVLAKAKALEAKGREIIHLEIGEPDFDTPAHVVEAGCKVLRDGHTQYTPTAGIPELREAIARDVARSRGFEVRPEQGVVTPGGKPIMFFSILALVDDDDLGADHQARSRPRGCGGRRLARPSAWGRVSASPA